MGLLKKATKVAVVAAPILVLALGAAIAWIEMTYQRDYASTPLPAIVASSDPEVIARGEYLVHALGHCSACHGPAESARRRELSADKTNLIGGFEMEAGPFGTYRPANLTSDVETGIGGLSDGVLARAIRTGVDRHGRIAPFMRLSVGTFADEDLAAIVSYLRTLPPRKNAVADDDWGFLAKALAGSFTPRNEAPPAYVAAAAEPSVARGAYIANGPAACIVCHTPVDPSAGFAPAGPAFSGAHEAEADLLDAAYEIVAPNLTPDVDTGHITAWTEEQFVARFIGATKNTDFHGTKMPWPSFALMTDSDVRSVYRYLRTLPPTRNVTGPTRRLAGSWHAPK
jgi:mono/diheme cytochrome c family protein